MIKVKNIFRLMILAVVAVLGVSAHAQSKIYYVSPTGTGDGSSWGSTMALKDALNRAVAGDQVWAMGYETISSQDQIYITPDQNGFVLKSGVQFYGGFKGTEKNVNDRETLGKPYQLRYRSVLSGDISRNDKLDTDYLIFPMNETRQDNAWHVLQMNLDPSSGANNNASATVVNGLTIANGQASGSDNDAVGGGIRIYGDNSQGGVFRVERCFLFNNYASRGGGLYVDAAVKNVGANVSLINQSVFYNNVSGVRSDMKNAGGGIWLDGQATVVNSSVFNNENGGMRLSAGSRSINNTVARNTAGGIDLTQEHEGNDYEVYNTIVWGNTTLSAEFQPKFKNSAFHEVTEDDTDNNIYVTKENRGSSDAPMFDAPSLKTSFDREFDWRQTAYPLWSWNVLEGSVIHNKGDENIYQTSVYGSSDMAGNARINETIDIGAYEFQHLPETRIRYVKEGGTGNGTSWDNASGDLQKMIDDLADNNPQNLKGEVWVAAGTYSPVGWLDPSKSYTAAFRMRDGIDVFGGFEGNETTKALRQKGSLPWQYQNETILKGASYTEDVAWNEVENKWTVSSSASRHVVWFAPFPYDGNDYFKKSTVLDGVTVMGGNAQGDAGISDFRTDCGGGVFVGRNCQLTNSVVKECSAASKGGAVYMLGGRLVGSLIYNSSAENQGGGVFVDNAGLVQQCMVTNCSSIDGGGIYMDRNAPWDGVEHPEYLILSTSVVTNNTNKANGAVYCNQGGVIMQSVIAKNKTVRSTDLTDTNAAQTGGLYLNEYGLVINSVLWDNELMGNITAQTYVKNPSQEKVRFYNVGVSNFNSTVWNNILQLDMIALADENEITGTDDEGHISPNFDPVGLPDTQGVMAGQKEPAYFWKPIIGSNLRAKGLMLGTFPDAVIVSPELDIEGNLFSQTPALGAYRIEATDIEPEVSEDGNTLRIYIDADCTVPEHNGSSWNMAYRSLNEALRYYANLSGKQMINGREINVTENTRLEIYVLEGNLWPRFAFVNLDAKSATIEVPASLSGATYYIYGGFRRNATNPETAERDPLQYRSIINGNHIGKNIDDGIYHCITVAQNAKVVIDGFHVINGHAVGESSRQYGAGLLAHDNSEVTVKQCIFENNMAQEGAAIDARAATLTMVNCVVNNNTNKLETSSVVNARTLNLTHVTFANNQGAVPASLATNSTSFAVGNTSGNTLTLSSVGEEGAQIFANPTNYIGAALGFDTYYGGYSEFRPLTSSLDATAVINKAEGTPADLLTDIVGRSRDLGGVADKGAYEAILPEKGSIYYVRPDGNDLSDGLSWDHALATVTAAIEKAEASASADPLAIWVAEGVYTHKSTEKIHDQYYGYKMIEGVNVYGGFPAEGTPGEDERDPKRYETVLQPGTTEPSEMVNNKEESFGRVLVQPADFSKETVWDGFILQHGYLFSCYRQNIEGNISTVKTDLIGLTGGAGAYLMNNGILENCVIRNNIVYVYPDADSGMDQTSEPGVVPEGGYHQAGAGIYNSGGIIRNCAIQGNKLQHSLYKKTNDSNVESAWMYGAGLYLNKGTVYNTIISGNVAEIITGNKDPQNTSGYHEVVVGAGAFLVSGEFYNNTIVGNKSVTYNTSRKNISVGGVYVYENITMYNCIVSDNQDVHGESENNYTEIFGYPVAAFTITGVGENSVYTPDASKVKTYFSCINIDKNNSKNLTSMNDKQGTNIYVDPLLDADFHLQNGSPAINTGTDDIEGVTIPDYDAEYTDRIKDCAIDMGAFESLNSENIACETVTEDGAKKYVYYVTQNGKGLRSGASADNAACAMKLQQILVSAGDFAAQHTDGQVLVRIAGYNPAQNPFVYHANTLSEPKDPQSYTFVVPEGIIVEGGYSEDFSMRNPAELRTRLSALKEATQTQQSVNGYHVVTFKDAAGNTSLQIDELKKTTIIDGLYLEDGYAMSKAGEGSSKTMGGGAIVPKGAHVRNCVVTACEAIQGGGLYLLPGAMVSGSLIQNNSAEQGAGIFADNEGADATVRSRVISCTVTDNSASTMGGGIFHEDGAVSVLNTVIWGNVAPSDRNVSGIVTVKIPDTGLLEMVRTLDVDQTDEYYYPYNYCFVETFEMPTSFENVSMTSDEHIYFEDESRQLKVYSPMIKRGMLKEYVAYWQNHYQVAEKDMNNVLRLQIDYTRADAGAYAYEGGPLQLDQLITRIFVSKGTNVQLVEGEKMETYLGRSFHTSLSHLDDALEYIKRVRENNIGGADDQTVFEIFLGPGIYKPSVRRMDAATTILDQRLNSFVVPVNVKIYGGFSGSEPYSFGIDHVPAVSGNIALVDNGDLFQILNGRTFSDLNGNSILEPWELSNQAVLSGEVDVSLTTKNVYHVLYSSASEGKVVLDGLTVMSGETTDSLSQTIDADEIGRGGAIYSNGVDYTLHRCRLMNNKAVRGGAMCVRNANATLIGCVIGGNGPTKSYEGTSMRGGAVYVAGNIGSNGKQASLRAVNTLFVNNETRGQGGAIALNDHATLDLMNCDIVRNKAENFGAIYAASTSGNKITNSVIWGNEDQDSQAVINDPNVLMTYSASEWLTTEESVNNIHLNVDNMAVDGPRFKKPSTVAGVAGNQSSNMWNFASVSVLADVGNGYQSGNQEEGAYKEWFDNYAPSFQGQYMSGMERYRAPLDEFGQVQTKKVIDIGLFEYPHPVDLSKLDAVYVATEDAGLADGTSWANAISDLKQAIIAMANPTGFKTSKDKKIYVRGGVYSNSLLSQDNVAFPLYMSESSENGTSLEIVGSCTGVGHEQNFSVPTTLTVNPLQPDRTNILLNIDDQSAKPVTVSGFTFVNTSKGDGTFATTKGKGVNIMNIGTNGSVVLKNSAFRNNYGYGLSMVENDGSMLLANVLFADGSYAENSQGIGLQAVGKTTVVNATFAQNRKDVEQENGALLSVYNSVSWNNEEQNMPLHETNVVFGKGIANGDIQNGPNFVDPEAEEVMDRDYGIRPSMNLLNQGDNSIYNKLVLNHEDLADIPSTEKDLADNVRQTGKKVDLGAYECSADLRQVIYVKTVVGGNGSGESWTNATNDLQGAIDLAAVYAANNSGNKGYVFVHNTQPINNRLRVSMPGTVVYGGMNDEISDETDVSLLVKDLLEQRQGILANSHRTQMNAGLDITENSLVDGFEITGNVGISNEGCLATSIVKGSVSGSGEHKGLLYNSLIVGDAGNNGNVQGVKAVNVTATGIISGEEGSGNNRASAIADNAYVTDSYWNYQLMENSDDIDNGTLDILAYMEKVGHDDDLIGNKRVRNVVDNGCFETWFIDENTPEADRKITTTDYPIGKSVVYVCKDQELQIENPSDMSLVYPSGTAFSPGFLLLAHQAGLRGNRNNIRLTNFAVEREIPNGKSSLIAMPFDVDSEKSYLAGMVPKRYDGSKRAAYDYKFDRENSSAWIRMDLDYADLYEGLLFENETGADQTLRFYGSSNYPYVENGTDKTVELKKYNYNERWTTDENGNIVPNTSNRITYKENMSWNLIGSPYLCDMNYADLQYGRVIYGYQDGYKAIATYEPDGSIVSGYIPVGAAVFTQTATLKDTEVFSVAQPEGERTGTAYAGASNLLIALSADRNTKSRSVVSSDSDVLQLNAVSPDYARADFDVSSDGVKWLSDSLMQVYAERSGGRYSLLSAVNIEGEVPVSVYCPEAGNYVLSVPEDCDASDYTCVRLKDLKNGREINLLDESYRFTVTETGEQRNRFLISFDMSDLAVNGLQVTVQSKGNGIVCLSGLQKDDRIQVYDANGISVTAVIAQGSEQHLQLKPGVYIFAVYRGSEKAIIKSVLR